MTLVQALLKRLVRPVVSAFESPVIETYHVRRCPLTVHIKNDRCRMTLAGIASSSSAMKEKVKAVVTTTLTEKELVQLASKKPLLSAVRDVL
ncbi:hypothetical protein PsorP6_015566 [Peronosclerospora sorghi]|uniref:Uncharacterized protein n=1 Tax=Peronosclerospora sorghi TaxID=230839 RepID=A0ACC0WQG8_9STRA|nr:hypothetical protein PsorP6_015566 [Peronosclerospora sorghi]